MYEHKDCELRTIFLYVSLQWRVVISMSSNRVNVNVFDVCVYRTLWIKKSTDAWNKQKTDYDMAYLSQ